MESGDEVSGAGSVVIQVAMKVIERHIEALNMFEQATKAHAECRSDEAIMMYRSPFKVTLHPAE